MRAAIVGCGRMGRAVEEVLLERGHDVSSRIGKGGEIESARGSDIAFEFTRPPAAERNVTALLEAGVPTICGTTGWDPAVAADLSRRLEVPLLVAPNFSIGAAVLNLLAREASRLLANLPEFEAGIFERHHSRKADIPSGTARMLAAAVVEASPARPIPPIAALRQGGAPGEHRIFFEGEDETVELVHQARSRRIFAAGAVRAAEWMLSTGRKGPVRFEDYFERRPM